MKYIKNIKMYTLTTYHEFVSLFFVTLLQYFDYHNTCTLLFPLINFVQSFFPLKIVKLKGKRILKK